MVTLLLPYFPYPSRVPFQSFPLKSMSSLSLTIIVPYTYACALARARARTHTPSEFVLGQDLDM